MRLSQLSEAAGLSPATVKWYLRIGLLHRGEQTAVNQAQYDRTHLQRLRLIRALVDVGGLSTDAVRDILSAIDDADRPVDDVIAVAHRACAMNAAAPPTEAGAELGDAFIRHRGWQVGADSPARSDLAAVLAALAALRSGGEDRSQAPDVSAGDAVNALLDPYADAVEPLARAEIANSPEDLSRDELVERVVAGTILLEHALTALRRLAQEHHAAQRYGRPAQTGPTARLRI